MCQLRRFPHIIALLLAGIFVGGSVTIAGSKLSKSGNFSSAGESAPALKDVALQAREDPPQSRKFDEFGDVNCEDEMARLDNLAVTVQNEPSVKSGIVFYGGRRFRGRLPKRGEAAARAARLKPYLVERRGIPSERIVVIDGGYKEEFQVELWVIPAERKAPPPNPTIPAKEIKFQKGKATARQFKCQI